MGREIKRLPVDFEWPLNKVWKGFLLPEALDEVPCADCRVPKSYVGERDWSDGRSAEGRRLHDQWYGNAPFRPEDNGSTPLTADTPGVRAFAERNVGHAPEFYGRGDWAVRREARRLADLWNGQWGHHLNQDDVDALVADGRLMDFTHTFSRETRWQPKDPPVHPTAAEVNAWSLHGMGHDSINAYVVIRAYAERHGIELECAGCDGRGSHEAYPGQRTEAEAWEPTEPPAGEGWQLWETVSEGSPISPVFVTAEELAQWLTTPASCWGATKRPMTIEQARGFVGVGWAPSGFVTAGGVHDGAEYVGTEAALGDRDGL